jgi:hypothetical protein
MKEGIISGDEIPFSGKGYLSEWLNRSAQNGNWNHENDNEITLSVSLFCCHWWGANYH